MDHAYAESFYDSLIQGVQDDSLFRIPQDRILLFKGKGSEATTSEELQNWVNNMLPTQGQHSCAKQFNSDEYMSYLRESGSEFGMQAEAAEIERL